MLKYSTGSGSVRSVESMACWAWQEDDQGSCAYWCWVLSMQGGQQLNATVRTVYV
jgi:hypothetical protein